jgi:hypothetical protein
MPLSLTSRMSSKTNIRRRICSTRSGSSASRPSMMPFSVERSARLRISATVSTPPAFSKVWETMSERRCSRPRSTSLITSGLVCSMLATRLTTSICFWLGRPTRISRRLLRRQVREDQRDRLRVLVLDERQQVFALGLLQERERRGLHLLRDLLDHALGVVFGEGFSQQRLGVFQAAFAEVGVGQGEL